MNVELVSQFLIWGLAFIFSTTVHEASHALAALKGGDPTAYHGGQVTLDPIPHIKRSPFGMIIVPVIAFVMSSGNSMIGWASAPYDPYWAQRHPHRAALMALAGPVSNFLLAFICLILLRAGLSAEVFFPHDKYWRLIGPEGSIWHIVAQLLSAGFTLNIILGMFNLLPLPPLDGATAILLFFPERKAHEVGQKIASLGLIGLVIAWLIFREIGGEVVAFAWLLVHLGT